METISEVLVKRLPWLLLPTTVLLLSANPAPPTYHQNVAPILQANCVGCHTQGGVGPFPLDDPEWAARMAPVIVNSVQSGRMPPWPPGQDSPPLQGERRLSAKAVQALSDWAQAGAPIGKEPYRYQPIPFLNPKPVKQGLAIPAYKPDAKLYDDYRCFLIDPSFKEDTFVKGYRIYPDQAKMVHHVILFVVGPNALGLAKAKDGQDGRPGWPCFGGPNLSNNPADLGGFLGFWVPGTSGTDFPEGTGTLMRAGSFIVAQMHYNTGGGVSAPDQTRFELIEVPAAQAKLKSVGTMTLAAPVEVRCPPGREGPECDRQYALQQSELPLIANFVHNLCRTTIDEYQARAIGNGGQQSTSCTTTVSSDRLLLGATLHMHLRGTAIRIDLNPDTPEQKTLLSIPRWDFQWQGQYWYQAPIAIKRGDRLRITCVYDNSGPIPGPGGEPLQPRYMTWGEGTTDEMCLGALSFVRP